MHEKKAKIVCLVPSWTETLLSCNLNVVGRTRFCIHPQEKVRNISVVGGTKSFQIDEILALQPDFVILDKEENKKEMADELLKNNIEILVSHVDSLGAAVDFLNALAQKFESTELLKLAEDYRLLLRSNFSRTKFFTNCVLQKNSEIEIKNLEYIIWKNPYMAIGANTFINDVFNLFSLKLKQAQVGLQKYPQIEETDLLNSYCLFSSEPFPFEKYLSELDKKNFKYALVDGEKISWYGIRNLNFLKSCQE